MRPRNQVQNVLQCHQPRFVGKDGKLCLERLVDEEHKKKLTNSAGTARMANHLART
jgi:hypothetical protein